MIIKIVSTYQLLQQFCKNVNPKAIQQFNPFNYCNFMIKSAMTVQLVLGK